MNTRMYVVMAAVAFAGIVQRAPAQCPPGTPSNLNATDDLCAAINLTWNSVSGADWYEVWRNTTNNFDTATRIALPAVPTYLDLTVAAEQTYHYWVTSWRVACLPGNNRSGHGNRATGRKLGIPDAVQNLTASDTRCDGVLLEWDLPTSGGTIGSMNIWRSTTSNFSNAQLVAGAGPGTTSYLNGAAPANVPLWYWVFSANSCFSSNPASAQGFRLSDEILITQQPVSARFNPCQTASLSCQASSDAERTFRWFRLSPSQFINDGPGGASVGGGVVSGASSRTLQITGARASDSGVYRCLVVMFCGGETYESSTNSATLTICAADINCDGGVTIDDVFVFLNAWFARCDGSQTGPPCEGRSADFDGFDGVAISDIFAFLNAWFAGC